MEDFKELGLVKDYVGENGKLGMLDTNIAGENRIMITLVKESGEKLETLLSTTLSKQFRQAGSGRLTLGAIMNLQYGVNALGRHYIVRPKGTYKEWSVGELTLAEYKVETLDFDKLVAL